MLTAKNDYCPICGSKMIEGMTRAYCSKRECRYSEKMVDRGADN